MPVIRARSKVFHHCAGAAHASPRLRIVQRTIVALAVAAATTPAWALHGIDPNDIDKSASACTDFFDYANGTWRKNHAIPDYMDRWSKRWESGEINKEHVRDILTDLSTRTDWPTGSAEQLSAISTPRAWTRRRSTRSAPSRCSRCSTRSARSRRAPTCEHTIGHLHDIGVAVPFGVAAQQDLHDPTHGHRARRGRRPRHAGSRLLPQARQALRRSAREVPRRTWRRCSSSPARSRPTAKQDAATVFAFEKRLAEASLDNVALRDPKQQDHKTTFADLPKLAPDFDWAAYFDAAKMPRNDRQRDRAEVRRRRSRRS